MRNLQNQVIHEPALVFVEDPVLGYNVILKSTWWRVDKVLRILCMYSFCIKILCCSIQYICWRMTRPWCLSSATAVNPLAVIFYLFFFTDTKSLRLLLLQGVVACIDNKPAPGWWGTLVLFCGADVKIHLPLGGSLSSIMSKWQISIYVSEKSH